MTIQERKKNLEETIRQKISQLQAIEESRQQLTSEIIGINANIKLLDELIKEGSSENVCQETTKIQPKT